MQCLRKNVVTIVMISRKNTLMTFANFNGAKQCSGPRPDWPLFSGFAVLDAPFNNPNEMAQGGIGYFRLRCHAFFVVYLTLLKVTSAAKKEEKASYQPGDPIPVTCLNRTM